MGHAKENHDFDLKLAIECARAYSASSGLGCTVSDADGNVLFETGYSCSTCGICEASGLTGDVCVRSQAYGMTEAERFGGKYVYFCPMGLTCLVSPIMGQTVSSAKITAGPFLMASRDDYVAFDLEERLKLDNYTLKKVLALTDKLPCVSADKVNSLSVMLFMSVGFMNNVSNVNRMLEIQDSGIMQGQITEYIIELKAEEKPPEYPVKIEKALIASIADSDKQTAHKLLNELLGYILFASGGNFPEIKSRIYELLVVISRAAADAGGPAGEMFRLNHRFYQETASTVNIDELCYHLSELMNKYIDSLFSFAAIKNVDVINKAIHFMRQNCTQKIVLEDVAKIVFLSPTYFSKVFKQEMGQSFNSYLNKLRIEKSKQMLLRTEIQLVSVAGLSGFEDQSYFTKVFKRITGMSPNQYRKLGGRYDSGNHK